LTLVYLVWGVIASLNDLLIPYLKNEFGLNYSQAMRVQLVFYTAYLVLSIPCGLFTRRFGYRSGILAGITCAATGCVAMLLGAQLGSFAFLLSALFVIASGITMLQVSANPFATALGPSKTAPSRLTLVQSFHSLGTTIGPSLGALLMFGAGLAVTQSLTDSTSVAPGIIGPYLLLACTLLLVGMVFFFAGPGAIRPARSARSAGLIELLRANPRLVLGMLGIFCYVGAEIAIGSFLVNYLGQPGVTGLGEAAAGKYVSLYWGLALAGRFIGAWLLRFLRPDRMLGCYAVVAMSLVLVSMNSSGPLSMWSIISVGFFNSIMFPTVFSLALREQEQEAERVSGLLCLGIVGGALVTQAQGVLADRIGIQSSFVLPAACYLYIALLGFFILRGRDDVAAG
jgi:FHS family L-fucose permease-like MFS transporter